MTPIDGTGYVIAAYVVTWTALVGYVLHLNARARAARESLAHDGADARRGERA
jgi:CcmD family protein